MTGGCKSLLVRVTDHQFLSILPYAYLGLQILLPYGVLYFIVHYLHRSEFKVFPVSHRPSFWRICYWSKDYLIYIYTLRFFINLLNLMRPSNMTTGFFCWKYWQTDYYLSLNLRNLVLLCSISCCFYKLSFRYNNHKISFLYANHLLVILFAIYIVGTSMFNTLFKCNFENRLTRFMVVSMLSISTGIWPKKKRDKPNDNT